MWYAASRFRTSLLILFFDICRAALHTWGKRAFAEILNVDKSRDMNNLSQLILQGGQSNKPALVPGVVYRQFMPHGREVCQHGCPHSRYSTKSPEVF
jgi:hypothetical protein